MSLAELQQRFQTFILDGTQGIERSVVGTKRVPVDTRLSIYSNAYRARLAEALESNYPVLAKLLGEGQFNDLAQAYAQRHRSAHFSIRWYGDRLAALLEAQEPYRQQPLLADLARWEWNMTLAFDAADAAPLQKKHLAELSAGAWAGLCFKPHPSLRLLCLGSDAPVVWRALNRDEAPPPESLGACATVGTETEKSHWVIWRRGLDTFFRSLDPLEAAALQAAARGDSFGAICEGLAETLEEQAAAARAAALLARWLEDEMLAE
jgi:hypothetical protein